VQRILAELPQAHLSKPHRPGARIRLPSPISLAGAGLRLIYPIVVSPAIPRSVSQKTTYPVMCVGTPKPHSTGMQTISTQPMEEPRSELQDR
jgi:hypothetical protein